MHVIVAACHDAFINLTEKITENFELTPKGFSPILHAGLMINHDQREYFLEQT